MTNEFKFIPVFCNRGRKWRGELAYCVKECVNINMRYNNITAKLWDPTQNKIVYCNHKFMVKHDVVDHDKINADKKAYINYTINSTLDWCRERSPNENEAKKFARNVLLKNYPEMLQQINDVLPDIRDVVAAIDRTLTWAMNLRPKHMFSKRKKQGETYSKNTIAAYAYASLDKKGYTKLDGFKDAWLILTQLAELPGENFLKNN